MKLWDTQSYRSAQMLFDFDTFNVVKFLLMYTKILARQTVKYIQILIVLPGSSKE